MILMEQLRRLVLVIFCVSQCLWLAACGQKQQPDAVTPVPNSIAATGPSFEVKEVEPISKVVSDIVRQAYSGEPKAQYRLARIFLSEKSLKEVADFEWQDKESGRLLSELRSSLVGAPDDAKAFNWFKKAADQGHAEGQWRLAALYATGVGIPKNDRRAAEIYLQLALKGDSSGQYNVGSRYLAGEGLDEDMVLAYAWLNIAAADPANRSSLSPADKLRDTIASKYLSPRQLAEAQRISSAWRVGQPLVRESR